MTLKLYILFRHFVQISH